MELKAQPSPECVESGTASIPAADPAVTPPQPARKSPGISDEAIVSATYRCVGTYKELKELSAWLRNSGIRYEAVDQKVIEP